MFIPVSISLYPNGIYNKPTSENAISITGNISSYAHSITARGGCESATIKLEVPLEIAVQYLNYILYHVKVHDEYSQQIWLGYIGSISLDFGNSTTTIGIDNYASRFVLFVDSNVAGTLYDDNAAQLYGDKIFYIRANANVLNATQITQNLTRALILKGSPNVSNKTTSETKSRQVCSVTINCYGYYSFTDWKTVGASELVGSGLDTGTTIINRVETVFTVGGVPYITGNTITTGVIDNSANRWDAYTLWSEVISDLIDCGTTSGQVLSYGIYPNGQFDLSISNINNQNVDYYKSVASAKIYDVNGAEIAPTQVLPNKNISITELRPSYTTYSQQVVGLQFIDRVSLQISRNGYSLTFEPSTLNDTTYDLARLIKQSKWTRTNE